MGDWTVDVVVMGDDTTVECVLDSLAGTGGITGLASCASNELTSPKLGALTFITLRPGKTVVGVAAELDRAC